MKGIVYVGILLFVLSGCSITTPEITGVVIDGETGQPVENAWITATLSLKIATIQGDVHVHPSVAPPHLRTDKEGKFVIRRQKFKKPYPPVALGTEPEGFRVHVETIDDKEGEVNLLASVNKRKIKITVPVGSAQKTEEEYFAYLQSLYRYCILGRAGVEVPPVKEGCDSWELDYAIAKHLKYLGTVKADKETGYYAGLEQLADLYEKGGNWPQAIGALQKRQHFIRKHNLLKFGAWQRNDSTDEKRIDALRQKSEKR